MEDKKMRMADPVQEDVCYQKMVRMKDGTRLFVRDDKGMTCGLQRCVFYKDEGCCRPDEVQNCLVANCYYLDAKMRHRIKEKEMPMYERMKKLVLANYKGDEMREFKACLDRFKTFKDCLYSLLNEFLAVRKCRNRTRIQWIADLMDVFFRNMFIETQGAFVWSQLMFRFIRTMYDSDGFQRLLNGFIVSSEVVGLVKDIADNYKELQDGKINHEQAETKCDQLVPVLMDSCIKQCRQLGKRDSDFVHTLFCLVMPPISNGAYFYTVLNGVMDYMNQLPSSFGMDREAYVADLVTPFVQTALTYIFTGAKMKDGTILRTEENNQ